MKEVIHGSRWGFPAERDPAIVYMGGETSSAAFADTFRLPH